MDFEHEVHGIDGIDNDVSCDIERVDNPIQICFDWDKVTCTPCKEWHRIVTEALEGKP